MNLKGKTEMDLEPKGILLDIMIALLILTEFFFLNTLMTVHNWLPEYQFGLLILPSIESISLFILLFCISLFNSKIKRWLVYALSLLLTLFVVFGIAEAVVRHAYQRSFVPWTDLSFLPGVFHLLFGESVITKPVFVLPVVILFVLSICFLFYFFFRLSIRLFTFLKYRFITFTGIALILLLYGFLLGFSETLIDDIYEQIMPPSTAELPVASFDRDNMDDKNYYFSRLEERNVLLFSIESYGYTAYSRPEHYIPLKPFFEEMDMKLQSSGYNTFSHFLTSPVIGGGSWLADATLLTGIKIDTQQIFEELLNSSTDSLPKMFHRAGYYTLLAAPGTVHGEWEEGRLFYGFDEDILGWDYGYKGPDFSFVPIPDQFAIYTIHKLKPAGNRAEPIFIHYTLVSSHGPYNKIPAYIDDWSELGDGSIYYNSPNLHFDNDWFSGKAYAEGYAAAIRYVMMVITNYLTGFIDDKTLIILVGDHQPMFPITEQGAPLSVPIHIISRDYSLIEPLTNYGYTYGLIPEQKPPHPGMETFLHTILEIFDGSDDEQITQ